MPDDFIIPFSNRHSPETVYEYRYQFEKKFFNKNEKQKRIGLFKRETFLGYCRE